MLRTPWQCLIKKKASSETQGENHISFRDDYVFSEEWRVVIRHLLKLTFHRRDSFCKPYSFCTLKERHDSERSGNGPDGMLHFTNTVLDCQNWRRMNQLTASVTKQGWLLQNIEFHHCPSSDEGWITLTFKPCFGSRTWWSWWFWSFYNVLYLVIYCIHIFLSVQWHFLQLWDSV